MTLLQHLPIGDTQPMPQLPAEPQDPQHTWRFVPPAPAYVPRAHPTPPQHVNPDSLPSTATRPNTGRRPTLPGRMLAMVVGTLATLGVAVMAAAGSPTSPNGTPNESIPIITPQVDGPSQDPRVTRAPVKITPVPEPARRPARTTTVVTRRVDDPVPPTRTTKVAPPVRVPAATPTPDVKPSASPEPPPATPFVTPPGYTTDAPTPAAPTPEVGAE